MSAQDHLPEGCLITERIEIIGVIGPEGGQGLSWHAATSDGEEIELARFLGLLEQVKFDAVRAVHS